jgi:hypothetical protein
VKKIFIVGFLVIALLGLGAYKYFIEEPKVCGLDQVSTSYIPQVFITVSSANDMAAFYKTHDVIREMGRKGYSYVKTEEVNGGWFNHIYKLEFKPNTSITSGAALATGGNANSEIFINATENISTTPCYNSLTVGTNAGSAAFTNVAE